LAHYLHGLFIAAVATYLDDWVFFGPNFPPQRIVVALTEACLIISKENSVLHPSQGLTYFGHNINILARTVQPTLGCLQKLSNLVFLVSQSTAQNLKKLWVSLFG
jgi:hypothetical protein